MLSYKEYTDALYESKKVTARDLERAIKSNKLGVMVQDADGNEYLAAEVDGDSVWASDEDGKDHEINIKDIVSFTK